MSSMIYWPYDEVALTTGNTETEILVDSPWLKVAVTLPDEEQDRARALKSKFDGQSLGPGDLPDINWFFSSLAKYPFCYVLPRQDWSGADLHYALQDDSLGARAPREFLREALKTSPHATELAAVAGGSLFDGDWKWDAEGALQFSQSAAGIDPRALFGVVRRYHLLSFLENDGTQALYAHVRSLEGDREKFLRASALMVRQNHYVTERCQSSLEPALQTALGEARERVREFIEAERGHDRILGGAMRSFGSDPASVPVTSEAKILMDLLGYSGRRNFLAFAMIVDFFERSAYQESDPLAVALARGGLDSAARHIDRHMNINDSGEHENVALGFLQSMGPVDRGYADEAIRIAEVTTNVMTRLAHGIRNLLDVHPPRL